MLKTDQVNSWKWQIKLKATTYRLNKLSKGAQHQISELNSEQITSLENKSHFLKLNDYNLNAKSDGSTVHSIKEKLSLYRQHREKGI
ncbi:MAG: hypothetical protein NE328_12650 [Lentisphaeraceae bacterium]|nr:hypothetical protein [Lentisphaeraceae bacterium]